jgi:hypothetical protein
MDKDYGEGLGQLDELGEEEYYYDTSEYQVDDTYYSKYDENDTYMEEGYEQEEDEEYKKHKELLAQLYGQDSFESSRDYEAGLDTYETDPYDQPTTITTEEDYR